MKSLPSVSWDWHVRPSQVGDGTCEYRVFSAVSITPGPTHAPSIASVPPPSFLSPPASLAPQIVTLFMGPTLPVLAALGRLS